MSGAETLSYSDLPDYVVKSNSEMLQPATTTNAPARAASRSELEEAVKSLREAKERLLDKNFTHRQLANAPQKDQAKDSGGSGTYSGSAADLYKLTFDEPLSDDEDEDSSFNQAHFMDSRFQDSQSGPPSLAQEIMEAERSRSQTTSPSQTTSHHPLSDENVNKPQQSAVDEQSEKPQRTSKSFALFNWKFT
jgi:hypothetical protein